MKFSQAALPLLFSASALAAPTPSKTLEARSTKICGQYDSVATGAYTVYQDLWGQAQASSGSQCSTITSLSGNTMVWSTAWSWQGASNQVKSYANVALDSVVKAGVEVSSISSIPAVWKWTYSGSNIVADVSWDIFTAATAGGRNQYEIMIWLAAIGGAGPISSTGSPIASVVIAGKTFNLYSGPNGDTTVYSFVATNEANNFSGDLLDFLTYLNKHQGWSMSQYINVLEAGTEPFTGSNAVFNVDEYSVAINKGSSTAVKQVASTTSSAPAKTSYTKAATSTPKATSSSTGSIDLYGDCSGGKTCSAGTCVKQNDYYSQCLNA